MSGDREWQRVAERAVAARGRVSCFAYQVLVGGCFQLFYVDGLKVCCPPSMRWWLFQSGAAPLVFGPPGPVLPYRGALPSFAWGRLSGV